VTIILIISIAFYMFRIGSGDPMMLYTPRDPNINDELYEEVVDNLHLDDSVTVQYVHYVYERLTGDFDYPSWTYSGRTITYVDGFVYDGMLKTLFLLTMVIGSSVLIGTAYGMLAAMPRRLSVLDALVSLPILVLFCIPAVCTALMALDLNMRADQPFPLREPYDMYYGSLTPYEKVIDILNHAFLPVLVGFLATVGFFALIVRTGIRRSLTNSENLTVDGMRVREQHLLVNAFHCTLPLIKLFVVASLAVVLTIDYVFMYRGLGYLLIVGAYDFDMPLLDVTFYLTALVAIVFMFAFEFLVTLAHRRVE
jgi:peptide/nickel transport system permease protein